MRGINRVCIGAAAMSCLALLLSYHTWHHGKTYSEKSKVLPQPREPTTVFISISLPFIQTPYSLRCIAWRTCQAPAYSLCLSTEGWPGWGDRRVAGYIPKWFTHMQTVTHPSANRARRRPTVTYTCIRANTATLNRKHAGKLPSNYVTEFHSAC